MAESKSVQKSGYNVRDVHAELKQIDLIAAELEKMVKPGFYGHIKFFFQGGRVVTKEVNETIK